MSSLFLPYWRVKKPKQYEMNMFVSSFLWGLQLTRSGGLESAPCRPPDTMSVRLPFISSPKGNDKREEATMTPHFVPL